MNKQKFYAKLKEDKENSEWWVDCGVKYEELTYDKKSTYPQTESGTVAFHKNRNQCLINAADSMVKEALRLYGMVK